MSDDQLSLWRAEIAALGADLEDLNRDIEPISRLLQALNDLEGLYAEGLAQLRVSPHLQPETSKEIEVCWSAIAECYQGAALYIQRRDIDPTPLLVWVRTKPIAGVAQLRVLIQRAAIVALRRREQLQKSLSVLLAKVEAHAESERPEGIGTGRDPAKDGPPEEIDEETRQLRMSSLTSAVRRAYLSYEVARSKAEKRDMEDWEAYQLLKEEGIPEDGRGELTDYRLPARDTWIRYLRKARQTLAEQKYTSRRGRPHGKSIVRQDQIE